MARSVKALRKAVKAMTPKELRRTVEAAGMSAADCFDKAELQALAVAALEAQEREEEEDEDVDERPRRVGRRPKKGHTEDELNERRQLRNEEDLVELVEDA